MRSGIDRDLADTEARMERLCAAYVQLVLRGEITRARTTTYNARMDALAERRRALRPMKEDESPRS